MELRSLLPRLQPPTAPRLWRGARPKGRAVIFDGLDLRGSPPLPERRQSMQ